MTYSGDPGTTGINGEKVFLEKKKKKKKKKMKKKKNVLRRKKGKWKRISHSKMR